MTHFKGRAVNLTLTALELDYTSHPQQQSHLSPTHSFTPLSYLLHRASSLSQPPATSVFLQQPQTGKGIYSLNLTQIAHSQAKPLSSSSTSIFLRTPDWQELVKRNRRRPYATTADLTKPYLHSSSSPASPFANFAIQSKDGFCIQSNQRLKMYFIRFFA